MICSNNCHSNKDINPDNNYHLYLWSNHKCHNKLHNKDIPSNKDTHNNNNNNKDTHNNNNNKDTLSNNRVIHNNKDILSSNNNKATNNNNKGSSNKDTNDIYTSKDLLLDIQISYININIHIYS